MQYLIFLLLGLLLASPVFGIKTNQYNITAAVEAE